RKSRSLRKQTMRATVKHLSRTFLAVLLTLAAGCGGKGVPAGGVVKFKDGRDIAPMVGGTVEFESMEDEPAKRTNARGDIKEDGSFSLATVKYGKGVLPGKYRAIV